MADFPARDVAVCVVGDAWFDELADHPRVGISGTLATANIGIEHLVLGVLARPAITHLVVMGVDSPLFRPAQCLLALAHNGISPDGTVIGAEGFRPTLPTLRQSVVAEFRRHVRVHDLLGVRSIDAVRLWIDELPSGTRLPSVTPHWGPVIGADHICEPLPSPDQALRQLPLRGRRVPAGLTGNGYFVVHVDHEQRQIVLRHYSEDLRSGHVVRSHCAEALALSVVEHGLLRDCAHAAYLGAELAKAEVALRAGLTYVQDRPLRLPRSVTDSPTPDAGGDVALASEAEIA